MVMSGYLNQDRAVGPGRMAEYWRERALCV
jgi:hypothetical protein